MLRQLVSNTSTRPPLSSVGGVYQSDVMLGDRRPSGVRRPILDGRDDPRLKPRVFASQDLLCDAVHLGIVISVEAGEELIDPHTRGAAEQIGYRSLGPVRPDP